MTNSKKRKEQDGTKLQAGIKGREFDIASKLFNLTDTKNPDQPEQRLHCPICGAKHCFDFNREYASFYCEGCRFMGDLTALVLKARKVSHNKAHEMIEKAAGLCADEKLEDRISTTVVTDVPANNTGDTKSEQIDDNTAGGYSSHLDAETQMIPLEHIELSDDYHFRAQDDEDTIESYADILRQYCDDLAEGQSVSYPFTAITVLNEQDDVYYVISGRHRFQAAEKAGIEEIACIVFTDRIEAIQEGLKSNRQHGLRLNNADIAHCIKLALNELKWSNRRIADLLGCSRQYVDKIAKTMRSSSQDMVIGKDGKEYPASGECKKTKKNSTEDEVLEIAAQTVSSKTPSNQNDHIVDELQAALNLTVDTPKRSDALFDVFKTIVADCFKNNQVRRAFLQKVQQESSEYGVHPLRTNDNYNDAA